MVFPGCFDDGRLLGSLTVGEGCCRGGDGVVGWVMSVQKSGFSRLLAHFGEDGFSPFLVAAVDVADVDDRNQSQDEESRNNDSGEFGTIAKSATRSYLGHFTASCCRYARRGGGSDRCQL